jgi:hypothetical protein
MYYLTIVNIVSRLYANRHTNLWFEMSESCVAIGYPRGENQNESFVTVAGFTGIFVSYFSKFVVLILWGKKSLFMNFNF